jgi:hypothetical protein
MTATVKQFVLRLTEEEDAALAEQAEAEHTSKHAVALDAVRERIGRRRRLEALLGRAETKHARTLAILADS